MAHLAYSCFCICRLLRLQIFVSYLYQIFNIHAPILQPQYLSVFVKLQLYPIKSKSIQSFHTKRMHSILVRQCCCTTTFSLLAITQMPQALLLSSEITGQQYWVCMTFKTLTLLEINRVK